jgi:hypothetical protein
VIEPSRLTPLPQPMRPRWLPWLYWRDRALHAERLLSQARTAVIHLRITNWADPDDIIYDLPLKVWRLDLDDTENVAEAATEFVSRWVAKGDGSHLTISLPAPEIRFGPSR